MIRVQQQDMYYAETNTQMNTCHSTYACHVLRGYSSHDSTLKVNKTVETKGTQESNML